MSQATVASQRNSHTIFWTLVCAVFAGYIFLHVKIIKCITTQFLCSLIILAPIKIWIIATFCALLSRFCLHFTVTVRDYFAKNIVVSLVWRQLECCNDLPQLIKKCLRKAANAANVSLRNQLIMMTTKWPYTNYNLITKWSSMSSHDAYLFYLSDCVCNFRL